jgi:uncharacterized protein (TIGR02217 family)
VSSLVYPALLGLTPDVTRKPVWSTKVQAALSGKRTTIAKQYFPRMHFELNYDILRDDLATSDLKALVGLFNQVAGSYDTFLFQDPDYNAVTAMGFGTGDGATTAFPLSTFYANSGGVGYYEMVQALNGAPSIYINGTLQITGYSVSSAGVVTFSTAPALNAALTWSGSFYYRCAFDSDELPLKKFMNKWWQADKVAFNQVHI